MKIKHKKILSSFLPAFGAMLAWGIWGFLPKIALQTLPSQDIVFYEAVGNLIIAAPLYFFILKGRVEKDKRAVTFTGLASLLTVLSILSYFQALRFGPVSIISPLTSLYPVICIILAWIFLKERINKLQMLAMVMALAAIILLAG